VIPYGRHAINNDDINEVIKVLRSDWLTTGPLVDEFEKKLSNYLNSSCIAVSSGTAALHTAYKSIGIGQGDEIITPPLTFIATQAMAAQLGAKIVFADILPDTGCIDPEKVLQAITKKTKAIVAVDYAGHPCELKELRAIADKFGIFLVEDAAHSFGSKYFGEQIGSIADLTTFSFFATKNLTTGEGGAISSINNILIDKARLFSRQGLVREKEKFIVKSEGPWHQEVQEFGLNYRLPDILCALGISQLRRIENSKILRANNFEKHNVLMRKYGLETPVVRNYVEPMWHFYPLKVKPDLKLSLFNSMRKNGIGAQVNYFPAHLHPVFRKEGFKLGDYPVAETFYSQEISLPLWPELTTSHPNYFEKLDLVLSRL